LVKASIKTNAAPKPCSARRRPFWEVGWGGVEVEVDRDTGNIKLLNYVSACDAGKAINPEQCIGQDEGAVMFGIGHTLMEEMIYEDGQLLNGNMVDYRVPTFKDCRTSCTRF
jgi:CO/xanthine dehydrogenase Mo-binding subunit